MEKVDYYRLLRKFSFFNTYFAFLDTEDYLADGLFIKHQVRVYFGNEFVDPGIPYRIIFCHVRKWDAERFRAAMSELPDKMLLCGNVDYCSACDKMWERYWRSKMKGVISVAQMVPLDKRSKKAQREYHAKRRGSWYGVSPVTRTVPSGKVYDRNRVKRAARGNFGGSE